MKRFFVLLIAGIFMFSACIRSYEPEVDFGSNTYINDYSALINSINNASSAMDARVAALNELIGQDVADVTATIGQVGGEIVIFIDGISTNLTDGFVISEKQADSIGNTVVAAVNETGENLQISVTNLGKVIGVR